MEGSAKDDRWYMGDNTRLENILVALFTHAINISPVRTRNVGGWGRLEGHSQAATVEI